MNLKVDQESNQKLNFASVLATRAAAAGLSISASSSYVCNSTRHACDCRSAEDSARELLRRSLNCANGRAVQVEHQVRLRSRVELHARSRK